MNDLYLLCGSTIRKYNGEILKRSINDRVVKVISNPTIEDLKEFGYMELIRNGIIPEHNPDTQIVETFYEIKNNKIYENFKISDIAEDINEAIIQQE